MRTILVPTIALLALSLTSVAAIAADDGAAEAPQHPELKAYPPAEEGMERFVIVLPHKERGEEDAFKVELVAGKVMETDGVNLMRLDAKIETKVVSGWGYSYYEVAASDKVMSTLMAPPPGQPRVKKFVAGDPLLIRYNSRLPVVVYAPKGYEIRYRVWSAPPESKKAKQG
jgi:ecotin